MPGITQGYENIVEGYKEIMAAKNRIELLIDNSDVAKTELIEIKKSLEYGLNCIEGGYVAIMPDDVIDDTRQHRVRGMGGCGHGQ